MAFAKMIMSQSKTAKISEHLSDYLSELWREAYYSNELDGHCGEACEADLIQIENCGDILEHLPQILQNVFDMKIRKESAVNFNHPTKAIEIRRDVGHVYYHSTTINGRNCNCPITFGGEAYREVVEQCCRPASGSVEGMALQKWLAETLLTHHSWYRDKLSVLTCMNEVQKAVSACTFSFWCCLLFLEKFFNLKSKRRVF